MRLALEGEAGTLGGAQPCGRTRLKKEETDGKVEHARDGCDLCRTQLEGDDRAVRGSEDEDVNK